MNMDGSEEESVETAELFEDAKLKYQRVISATVRKLKVPFVNSGTDLSVLEEFEELWTADLEQRLGLKDGEMATTPDANIPQADGNDASSSSEETTESEDDDWQTVASLKYGGSNVGGNQATTSTALVPVPEEVLDVEVDGFGNHLGLEKPIGRDDDMTDEEDKNWHTNNTVHCVIKKLTRSKGIWKMDLEDGVMTVDGADHFFKKASVEAKW